MVLPPDMCSSVQYYSHSWVQDIVEFLPALWQHLPKLSLSCSDARCGSLQAVLKSLLMGFF